MGACLAGEAKSGVDGEEKGIISFGNGNNELASGAYESSWVFIGSILRDFCLMVWILNLTERRTSTWDMDGKKEWQRLLQNDCKQ